MGTQINVLDDIQIKHWVNKGAPIARSDGGGLTFTLSEAGTATWILRYRMGAGRRKELTLGNYPDLSLAKARQMAREHRVSIDKGEDPAAKKKVEKMQSKMAWTVRALIDDYKQKKLVTPSLAEGTIYYRKWDAEKSYSPNSDHWKFGTSRQPRSF